MSIYLCEEYICMKQSFSRQDTVRAVVDFNVLCNIRLVFDSRSFKENGFEIFLVSNGLHISFSFAHMYELVVIITKKK